MQHNIFKTENRLKEYPTRIQPSFGPVKEFDIFPPKVTTLSSGLGSPHDECADSSYINGSPNRLSPRGISFIPRNTSMFNEPVKASPPPFISPLLYHHVPVSSSFLNHTANKLQNPEHQNSHTIFFI
ncbi:hypothetical protein Salat_0270000 [Sesamum alatum]|uniref:Uncharacterized protein n=1 Tax=Sesamum alatum TaxID=300844 RepID=A0AAE1Z0Z2_9LAMI|nr:hypothetical protein Salat_0270000 [Sesamum alatum]